jgi:rSAM/selenodomain-associated transferase 2
VPPDPVTLSIIIPSLNAAPSLGAVLDSLAEAPNAEIVISDGGSADDTVRIASWRGARVLIGLPGRGRQLRAGGSASSGDWLLFLHADTTLEAGWYLEIMQQLILPGCPQKAATFRFRLDDDSWQAWLLERLVALRVTLFGLPYGDQGLVIHRSLYEEIGGFDELPLMEDVAIIERIGKSRLIVLRSAATTSASRWKTDGWWRRSARNLRYLFLYKCGVSPKSIAEAYGR